MGKLSNHFAAAEARILHVVPGRVRIHLPGWSPCDRDALETLFRQLGGVRHVSANPWTGNVLVHFDPKATQEATLLAAVGRRAASQRFLSPAASRTSPTPRANAGPWLVLAKLLLHLGAVLTGLLACNQAQLLVGGAETLLRLGRLLTARPLPALT
jgi:hypothetical protein